jgi:hypothetical protein
LLHILRDIFAQAEEIFGMIDSLYELLRNRYHAYPLNLSTARAVPGMLLDCRWRPTWPGAPEKPEFLKESGLAWEFLKVPKGRYASIRVAANLIRETIRGKIEVGASLGLPQLGVAFQSGGVAERTAILEVSGVEVRSFRNTAAAFDLLQQLQGFEGSKSKLWPWVNDDFLVTHAYYVTSLRFLFRSEGRGSVRGELDAVGWKASGGMTGSWKDDCTYEVEGRSDVPAAVQGIRI